MKIWSRAEIIGAILVSVIGTPAAAPAARQDGPVSGQVIDVGEKRGLAGVSVTFVGPMEGQAERALTSFPLMAEEIAERLNIPQSRETTDAEGRFRFYTRTPGLYALVFRRDSYVGPAKPGDPLTSVLVTARVTVVEGATPRPVVVEMIRRATQAVLRFEVASIKRSPNPLDPFRVPSALPGGSFEMVNNSITSLIVHAYQVERGNIVGLPDWVATERYTIQARSNRPDVSADDVRLMVRELLVSRFGLKSHAEPREIPVLELSLKSGKPGPRLVQRAACKAGETITSTAPPPASGSEMRCASWAYRPTALLGAGVTMENLASNLSTSRVALGPRVVNRTGLEGTFDLVVEFSNPAAGGAAATLEFPSLPVALDEQLGLKLTNARQQIEMFVVDQLERPSAD